MLSIKQACELTGRSRPTYYRRCKPQAPTVAKPRPTPQRALSEDEKQEILKVLRSERFCDLAPDQVYSILLDEDRYLCSVSTMYRILRENQEVKERRSQATHPPKKKPELLATKPNEIWSWDVTKLRGPHKGKYFDLLVAIDIFSRYVVGWMIVEQSNQEVAKEFLSAIVERNNIAPETLTLHMDRGSEMTAKSTVQLLADLKVGQSFSRPHVSNDNPHIEAHFKTLKYCSWFPESFGSIEDARLFCEWFFQRYNHVHRHSGIGYYTPASVHFGTAEEIRCQRNTTLNSAFTKHPERFVNKKPTASALPTASWINQPKPLEVIQNN